MTRLDVAGRWPEIKVTALPKPRCHLCGETDTEDGLNELTAYQTSTGDVEIRCAYCGARGSRCGDAGRTMKESNDDVVRLEHFEKNLTSSDGLAIGDRVRLSDIRRAEMAAVGINPEYLAAHTSGGVITQIVTPKKWPYEGRRWVSIRVKLDAPLMSRGVLYTWLGPGDLTLL